MFGIALLFSAVFSDTFAFDADGDRVHIGRASVKGVVDFTADKDASSFANVLACEPVDGTDASTWKWVVGKEAQRALKNDPSTAVGDFMSFIDRQSELTLPNVHPSQATAIGLTLMLGRRLRDSDDVIVAVASAATPKYRAALVEALKLMGGNHTMLVDRNAAVACAYVVDEWKTTEKIQRKVLFIDITGKKNEVSMFLISGMKKKVVVSLVEFTADVDVEKFASVVEDFETPDEVQMIGSGKGLEPFVKAVADKWSEVTVKTVKHGEKAVALGAAYIAGIRMGVVTGVNDVEFRKPTHHDFALAVGEDVIEVISRNGYAPVSTVFDTDRFVLMANGEALSTTVIQNGKREASITIDILSETGECGVSLVEVKGKVVKVKTTLNDEALRAPTKSESVVKKVAKNMLTAVVRREVEDYVEDMLDRIEYDLDLEVVATEAELKQAVDFLNSVKRNISENQYTLKEVDAMRDATVDKMKAIIFRATERKERPEALRVLQKAIVACERLVGELTAGNELTGLKDLVNQAKKYKKTAESQDQLRTPSILCEDMRAKAGEIRKKMEALRLASASTEL